MTDTTNIESLYRQHGAALVLFAAAMTGDRGRAQDAVHQVFLNLMTSGNPIQASDTKAYLFASVRNAVLNDIKARGRQVTLEAETPWFMPPDRDHAAEKHLQRALREIPDDQRQIVVLHIWGDLVFSDCRSSEHQFEHCGIAVSVCDRKTSRTHDNKGETQCHLMRMSSFRHI